MNAHKNYLTDAQKLRQKAEDLVKKKSSKTKASNPDVDKVKLIHELQVHQIELELQNEELKLANYNEKLAANNYIELFDFTPACYYTLSKEGDILNLNYSGAQMLGKEPSRLKNSKFGFFVSNDTRPLFNVFLDKVFDSRMKQSCEVTILIDGKLPMYVYIIGLITWDGKTCNLNMIDITERREAEEKMKDLLNKVTTSNKELADFAYVASHDLQEPLRMVTSFTQLLEVHYSDKLDDRGREYMQFVVDGAKRMYLLLNGLLDYSRVQTKGKVFMQVDTNHVLTNVLKNLTLVINERNAEIKFDELPVIYADEIQMLQLFQNLIANSIKFSTEPPRIYISSKSDKDKYVISVKDEGIGIESQYFEKIFLIFQRLVPKEQYEGIGIGLSICKRIVERHSGKIWVESEIGKGSTFFFTIPKNHQ